MSDISREMALSMPNGERMARLGATVVARMKANEMIVKGQRTNKPEMINKGMVMHSQAAQLATILRH